MWRVSKIQRAENIFLQTIDNYLFDDEIQVVNDKIIFTRDMQKEFITDNLSDFADITKIIADLLKLQEITVVLVDSATKEEKEVMIEIEGGIWWISEN